KSAETNIIRVDVKDIIDKITGESFKLDIEVEINGYIYKFSRIYKVSEVEADKTVIVGNISLVDDIENLEIKTKGTITNINKG
ncbi:MAG: hypothetical protein ACRC28_10245, partial [Clostridium sp.]|uniref:hypothetical protein n=1 Tax=Clostridium sp. TaxID=1506 RepID=UPI003F2BBA78